MKRAVIYARVSTRRQADDGLPVESQLEHCRAKAEALGASVQREFVDGGLSGTTDRRPAFQDALNYCAVQDVEYFICWSSSRFARNHLDAGNYKGVLARYGTRLIYSSSEVDIRTDDGWFIDAISAVIDERCAMCHNADLAQKNVALHTPELLKQHAQTVYQQASVLKLMPLSNATQMTDAERDLIKRWFDAGAPTK